MNKLPCKSIIFTAVQFKNKQRKKRKQLIYLDK